MTTRGGVSTVPLAVSASSWRSMYPGSGVGRDRRRGPVRKATFDDELTEREALVEFNQQREKTPGQIINEFEEMLEIERARPSLSVY